jgi:DNA excision repair protein ERCC-2
MSGTLQPLDEYHDSLGLPENSLRKAFPNIFPAENRLVVFDPGVTMKYEERLMDEGLLSGILDKASRICRATSRNTAVFFPSYDIMEAAQAGGFGESTGRKMFIEERGLAQSDLMDTIDSFKTEGRRGDDGAVLLSVIGGRVSEGIDFPDKELEVVVIVGIPYPRPTAKQRALQYYYDIKFGKGWDYTVKAPTARKLLQSIGRLIRSENDRGVAVILDRRAVQFKEYLPALRETEDPVKEVVDFWARK